MNLPQPILSVKLHKNTPDKLYEELGRFLFTPGCLTPSLFNDDSLYDVLSEAGVDIDDIKDTSIAGCQEPLIMGKDNANTTNSWFNLGKILELTLNDGYSTVTGKKICDLPSDNTDALTLLKTVRERFYKNAEYFCDEMNDDENYTRVKIRKNRHLLSEKLGISDERILLAVENLSRARRALDGDVSARVKSVLYDDYALFSDSFLFDVPPHIGLKCLGTIIRSIGGNNYQPRLNSLTIALSNLTSDCQFTLGHCTLRRWHDQILIVPEGAKTSIRKKNEKIKRFQKQS